MSESGDCDEANLTMTGATTMAEADDRADHLREVAGVARHVAAVGAAFAVVALALGLRSALGVAAGAALAVGNFWAFARVVRALLSGEGPAARWGVVAALKMGALFLAAWLLLRYRVASPLALVGGYAALPVGITLFGLFPPRSSGPRT